MIKAIFWDFDGTMVDTKDGIANTWTYIYKKVYNEEIQKDVLEDTFGEPMRVSLKKIFPHLDVEEALNIYREYQQNHCKEMFKLFPKVREMLEYLKSQNIPMAIVTSRGKKSTFEGMKNMGIEDFFELVITADDVQKPKPDKEPIIKAIDEMKLEKDQVIMVGDTKFDIEASKSAEVKIAIVGWSDMITNNEDIDVDFIIEDVKQFEEILKNF